MKTYARCINDIVVELFSTDGDITEMFHPDMIWVDVSSVSGIAEGWQRTNTGFKEPMKTAAALADEKEAVLKQMRNLRSGVLNALAGIAGRAERAGDTATAAACDAASTALLNITNDKQVIAAADGQTTASAVLACYKSAALALSTASPSSINAFDALELTL